MVETIPQEVHELVRVEFSRSLDEAQLKRLMEHLSNSLESMIDYTIARNVRVGYKMRYGEEDNQDGLRGIEFAARITPGKKYFDGGCVLAYVNGFRDVSDDFTKIKGFDFDQVPGWELSEYSRENRKLWEDTRKAVEEYINLLE